MGNSSKFGAALCATMKWLAVAAWCVMFASLLFYNFFINAEGLRPALCSPDAVAILWRSTLYCAADAEARRWNFNNLILDISPVGSVLLTMLAEICRRRVQRQS